MNTPRKVPAKPPLTLDAQITRLRERGMDVPNEDRARHYLGHLNYYRLRGYWMGLELPTENGDHRFRTGTTFDEVIRLYDFDRRLRLELNDAVERVEVSLRTHWAFVLAEHAGCIAHRNSALFNEHHVTLITNLERLYADRKEIFLRHYLERNEEPPVWAVCEVLSLGDLSKWLISIRDRKLRAAIAQPYALNETVLCSFAHHLTYVRNVCAHHARLWNRPLVVGTWALPKKPETLVAQLQRAPDASLRIYNTLVMLAWLMRIISPGSEWRRRIRALVDERPELWNDMGFPDGWQEFELWREVAA